MVYEHQALRRPSREGRREQSVQRSAYRSGIIASHAWWRVQPVLAGLRPSTPLCQGGFLRRRPLHQEGYETLCRESVGRIPLTFSHAHASLDAKGTRRKAYVQFRYIVTGRSLPPSVKGETRLVVPIVFGS